MNVKDYQNKLQEFNATDKYRKEMNFLFKLINPGIKEKILDYGCGIGTMVRYINQNSQSNCFGYDKNNYRIEDDPYIYRNEFFFPFDKVFFMHSFAHIPNIDSMFENVMSWALKPGSSIFILTPNRNWLDQNSNPDYIPDPTVYKHYTPDELTNIFSLKNYNIIQQGQFGSVKNGSHERIFIHATKK